jgi:hypothetical protein
MGGARQMKIWAEMIGVDCKVERRELVVVRRDADDSTVEDFGLTRKKIKAF